MAIRTYAFVSRGLILLSLGVFVGSFSKSSTQSRPESRVLLDQRSIEIERVVFHYFELARENDDEGTRKLISPIPASFFAFRVQEEVARTPPREETAGDAKLHRMLIPNLRALENFELHSLGVTYPALIFKRDLKVESIAELSVRGPEARVRVKVASTTSELSMVWDIFLIEDVKEGWKLFSIATPTDNESYPERSAPGT